RRFVAGGNDGQTRAGLTTLRHKRFARRRKARPSVRNVLTEREERGSGLRGGNRARGGPAGFEISLSTADFPIRQSALEMRTYFVRAAEQAREAADVEHDKRPHYLEARGEALRHRHQPGHGDTTAVQTRKHRTRPQRDDSTRASSATEPATRRRGD